MRDAFVKTIIIDTLGSIDKGKEKRIVIRLMEMNGYRYLDMRTFVLADGRWKATDKGITLSKNNLDSFLALLNQCHEPLADALNAKTPEDFEKEMKTRKSSGNIKTERKEHGNKQAEFEF